MDGYYSTFYSFRNTRHMAQYFDVPHGQLLWINGCEHLQLEPGHPADQITPSFRLQVTATLSNGTPCRVRVLEYAHLM